MDAGFMYAPFVFTPDGSYDGPIELAERFFAYVKGLESLQGEEKRQMLEHYRKPGLAREMLNK